MTDTGPANPAPDHPQLRGVARRALRVTRGIGTVEAALAGLFLGGILLLVLLQIFLRFVPLGVNSVWIGELARYSLVWMTFIVVGTLVSRHEHPVIESIDAIAKGMVRRVVIVFANVVVVAVSIAFAIDSSALVFTGVPTTTPVIGISMQVALAIPFIGFILAAAHAAIRAFAVAVGEIAGDEIATGDVA